MLGLIDSQWTIVSLDVSNFSLWLKVIIIRLPVIIIVTMCRGMKCLLIHDIRHHKSDISLSSHVQLLIFTVV